jgi:hypothetical protein
MCRRLEEGGSALSSPMRRRMARAKKKVDPFEFRGSDDESDDEDKLSAKRNRRNSGNSTPHSLRGSHAGGSSPCSDVDGDRSNCRARLSWAWRSAIRTTMTAVINTTWQESVGDFTLRSRRTTPKRGVDRQVMPFQRRWTTFSSPAKDEGKITRTKQQSKREQGLTGPKSVNCWINTICDRRGGQLSLKLLSSRKPSAAWLRRQGPS